MLVCAWGCTRLRALHAFSADPPPPRLGSTPSPTASLFLKNTMRDLSTTLCRGISRQVLATVPLRTPLNGHPVVAEVPECPCQLMT